MSEPPLTVDQTCRILAGSSRRPDWLAVESWSDAERFDAAMWATIERITRACPERRWPMPPHVAKLPDQEEANP